MINPFSRLVLVVCLLATLSIFKAQDGFNEEGGMDEYGPGYGGGGDPYGGYGGEGGYGGDGGYGSEEHKIHARELMSQEEIDSFLKVGISCGEFRLE